jgi:carbamoyltransferase
MTAFLGFSCSQHDPAIAVVDEQGSVTFAEANERGLKNKRGWHAPPDAFGLIEPILQRHVGAAPIAANLTWSRAALAAAPFLARLSRTAIAGLERMRPREREAALWRAWIFRHALYRAPASQSDLLLNLELRLREARGFGQRLSKKAWNHHLCHAMTACLSSPFDEALCVVMDGMGEGGSTAIYRFRDGRLTRLDRPALANLASLGHFFSQVTFAAGFDPEAGEEWKLMGLAAYGALDEGLYRNLRAVLKVGEGRLSFARGYAAAMAGLMPLRARGPMANASLAFTAQKVFEDVLFAFLTQVQKRWGGDNLVFTGGCALNSSANGKILNATPFRNLHIPMAPGDDGNAIGAALLGWQAAHPGETPPRFSTPYLGSELSDGSVDRVRQFGLEPCFAAGAADPLADFIADALSGGAIVGLARGRAEFGPRALGARSIIADPRSPGIRDRINASVKFREAFRPFAPSVLHERGGDYFQDYSYSPYMERTLKWLPERAPPGVSHVDNTGRLQSVTAAANPFFYRLISAFHRKTGLPIVLNTSFNVMGRPMVHDVEDAIGVFLTSDIDLLVLNDVAFRKPRAAG